MINTDKNLRILFEISSNLEGLFRHASTHAAGIVIAENLWTIKSLCIKIQNQKFQLHNFQ